MNKESHIMSNPRRLRLTNDRTRLLSRFANWPAIQITSLDGDGGEHYRVDLHLMGLTPVSDLEVRGVEEHLLEITLPSDYPVAPPECVARTPIFHPNLGAVDVDLAPFWTPQTQLDDLIVRLARCIAYQEYSLEDPCNSLAAHWAAENPHLLPLDHTQLVPPPLSESGFSDGQDLLSGRTMAIPRRFLPTFTSTGARPPLTPRPIRESIAALPPLDFPGEEGVSKSLGDLGLRLDFGIVAVALPPHRTLTIGRRPGNDIQCSDLAVSGFHAEIVRDASGIRVRDLGSTNGTSLNNSRIAEAPLALGDRITFGEVTATLLSES